MASTKTKKGLESQKEKITITAFDLGDRDCPVQMESVDHVAKRKRGGSRQSASLHDRMIYLGEQGPEACRGVAGVQVRYAGWGGTRIVGIGALEIPEDKDLVGLPTELDLFAKYNWLHRGVKRLMIGSACHALLKSQGNVDAMVMPFRYDETGRTFADFPSTKKLIEDITDVEGEAVAFGERYRKFAEHVLRTKRFGVLGLTEKKMRVLEGEYLDWAEQMQESCGDDDPSSGPGTGGSLTGGVLHGEKTALHVHFAPTLEFSLIKVGL